jgi:hypothetical protein
MAVGHLVNAARIIQTPDHSPLKPRNCHEAVLGWMLLAVTRYRNRLGLMLPTVPNNVARAWLILRLLSDYHGGLYNANQIITPQITAPWMWQNMYNQNHNRIQPRQSLLPAARNGRPRHYRGQLGQTGHNRLFPPNTFNIGDIIFFNFQYPSHSMVIVDIQNNGATVNAVGFNNAGTFGGPGDLYDPTPRNIADPNRWKNGANEITDTFQTPMGQGAMPLHSISYATARDRIRTVMRALFH